MEEDFDEILDALNDCGRLNDWELEFVDSMLQRRERSADWAQFLSDKQRGVLRKTYDKRVLG